MLTPVHGLCAGEANNAELSRSRINTCYRIRVESSSVRSVPPMHLTGRPEQPCHCPLGFLTKASEK